jgi:hypothetical protein
MVCTCPEYTENHFPSSPAFVSKFPLRLHLIAALRAFCRSYSLYPFGTSSQRTPQLNTIILSFTNPFLSSFECFRSVLHKYLDSPTRTPNPAAVNVAATGSIAQTRPLLRSIASLLPTLHIFTLFSVCTPPSLPLLFFCLSQCLGKRNPSDCHTAIALSRSGHTLSASTGFLGVCCCAPHWLGDRQRIILEPTARGSKSAPSTRQANSEAQPTSEQFRVSLRDK